MPTHHKKAWKRAQHTIPSQFVNSLQPDSAPADTWCALALFRCPADILLAEAAAFLQHFGRFHVAYRTSYPPAFRFSFANLPGFLFVFA